MTSLTTPRLAGLAVSLWLIAVAGAGYLGLFEALPFQAVPPLAMVGVVVPILVYVASPGLRSAMRGVGLWWITAVHVIRIPAALLFFAYLDEGLLPQSFVTNAGWGDFAAGVLALGALIVATRGAYWAMHVFGAADFVVAVGTGTALTLAGHAGMSTMATYPLVVIPLFLVGTLAFTHLAAFHLLLTGRASDAPSDARMAGPQAGRV